MTVFVSFIVFSLKSRSKMLKLTQYRRWCRLRLFTSTVSLWTNFWMTLLNSGDFNHATWFVNPSICYYVRSPAHFCCSEILSKCFSCFWNKFKCPQLIIDCFLVKATQLLSRLCPSLGPSVGPSVGPWRLSWKCKKRAFTMLLLLWVRVSVFTW